MAAILVDTNVLVYAHDRGEHEKQARAIEVLDHLQVTNSGWLSIQCLSEFFNIATHGRRPILTGGEAERQVELMSQTWRILNLTSTVVLEAIRGVRVHQLAYWDAQIWALARLNQIPVIFTEDFNVGATLEGVRFINPFAPASPLAARLAADNYF